MDEMNNMNEVTTEETSNEVTPVVETNHEVQNAQAEGSGINTWAGVGVAVATLTVGAIVAGVAKHKAKKAEAKGEKEQKPKKAKKHIKIRKPWEVVEDKTEATDVEYKDVVEDTTEEDTTEEED